jgi:hypothetical protein
MVCIPPCARSPCFECHSLDHCFSNCVPLAVSEGKELQKLYQTLNKWKYTHKSAVPTTRHEDTWGKRSYSSYSFSTSALDGGEWWASRPGRALPPVPIVQEVGCATEPVWTQRLEEKSFRLWRWSNPDRPVVQPVARHYTELPGSYRPTRINICAKTAILVDQQSRRISASHNFLSFYHYFRKYFKLMYKKM